MNDWNPEANEIFATVAAVSDREERERLLDDKCGNNVPLRRAVESLLLANDEAPAFLDEALVNRGVEPTADGVGKAIGTFIGPYKLLQKIGEGGFGVVYMAEQKQPMRRKVALKVIKAGMDTREVIARFEAERQALAMMEHPNIARVLDAGTTDTGRPYFVMELVRGVAITEFCDKNQMRTPDRMEMFATVCHAVQHAHHKGIIHRDIKPSNVMVTLNDGQPMVKVIDFGVAKAINRELTDKTLFTSYGQMVGTPQYMSPEQAEMSAMDIDTRSDIYSLGVLLYELLTGTTPLDLKSLREAGLVEVQRMIQSEDAPKPSDRLSTLGDELSIVATNRKSDPVGLRKMVCGDLDWIVMRALDKDRSRRYDSASAFGTDIRRYLNHEAVEACPPTIGYRLYKYVRRNRVALITGLVLAVSLIGGLIGTSWMAVEAKKQSRLATSAASEAEAQRRVALQAVSHVQDELRWRATMLALNGHVDELEQAIKDVEIAQAPNAGWGQRLRGIAALSTDPAAAVELLKDAIERGDETVAAYASLAKAYWRIGENPSARPYKRLAKNMVPKTPEDELFLAELTYFEDPRRTYEMADRVFKKFPSKAALAARAHACEHVGLITRDAKWFEQAISDSYGAACFSDEKVPGFPIFCHAWAIEVARAENDRQAVEYHTIAGKRLVNQLQRGGYGLGFFYQVIGELENAEEAYRAGAKGDNGKRILASFHLSQCEDDRVLQVIGEMESPEGYASTVDRCRAAILARSPDTWPMAGKLLLERLTDPDLDASDAVRWVGLLHQFGFKTDAVDEAKRLAEEFRKGQKAVPPALEFFAFEIDEEQLHTSAGDDFRHRSDAYYQIIQRLLGDGKIKQARVLLNQWDGFFHNSDSYGPMLRMRKLLKKNPEWPHWIKRPTEPSVVLDKNSN